MTGPQPVAFVPKDISRYWQFVLHYLCPQKLPVRIGSKVHAVIVVGRFDRERSTPSITLSSLDRLLLD
jgi:hypothetical protein